ncbi:MAG: precorrin-8X methylmutase [Lachnospiraceae bacterium]
MKIDLQHVLPDEIEKRSFEIIEDELHGAVIDELQKPVIKRVIHTTADFDYLDNLKFSQNAVKDAIAALKSGASIVTDTSMAMAGINKKSLNKLGGRVHCFIGDEDVAGEAKERNTTRSVICMERALNIKGPVIFAIGNAPTALIRVCELIDEGLIKPALVIGVPVGFVNVVEAKELMMASDAEYIVARGRKGGSNVAAAICNALIYMAAGER